MGGSSGDRRQAFPDIRCGYGNICRLFLLSLSLSRPGEIELRSGVVAGRGPNLRRRRQRLSRTPEGSEHTRYCRRARCMGHAFSLRPHSPYLRPPGLNEGGAPLAGDGVAYGRSTTPTFLTVQIRICPVHSAVAINNHCTDAEPKFR